MGVGGLGGHASWKVFLVRFSLPYSRPELLFRVANDERKRAQKAYSVSYLKIQTWTKFQTKGIKTSYPLRRTSMHSFLCKGEPYRILQLSSGPFIRVDYQPLFGKMSPHSWGSKTGPGRRRKSSLTNIYTLFSSFENFHFNGIRILMSHTWDHSCRKGR